MTAHIGHPSIRENGLDDGCPRCKEHAERPFDGLDDGNMEVLIDRIADVLDPRSKNEAIAMYRITTVMSKANKLYQRGWRPS
jgi:hypothetical protein